METLIPELKFKKLEKEIQNLLSDDSYSDEEKTLLNKWLTEVKEKATQFELAQKYGRPAVRVAPRKLSSFEEIVQTGNFNNGYYDHLEKNKKCRNAIMAPVTGLSEEELVLYWEDENQVIPGGTDIYKYFDEKGYEVVEKAHPSLLVNAMAQLTEEKLTEMGIPTYVNIILPTTEESLLPDGDGDLCFVGAVRNDGKREFTLSGFGGKWDRDYAFLLRKKKL